MRKVCRILLLSLFYFIITFGTAGSTFAAAVKFYDARVEVVVDGDTLRVRDGNGLIHKVRLANIDAPEMKQAYGQNSKAALGDLLYRAVRVEVLYKDQYQREVGTVYYGGQSLNLRQVATGNAWVYPYYAARYLPAAAKRQYDDAEQLARHKKLGLWHGATPVPPWQFRRWYR